MLIRTDLLRARAFCWAEASSSVRVQAATPSSLAVDALLAGSFAGRGGDFLR